MQTGISTACLYPEKLENSLEKLISLGFRTFEVFLNTWSEFQPPYIEKLKETTEKRGCRICSIHPYTSGYESCLLFSNYERRFWTALVFMRNISEPPGI